MTIHYIAHLRVSDQIISHADFYFIGKNSSAILYSLCGEGKSNQRNAKRRTAGVKSEGKHHTIFEGIPRGNQICECSPALFRYLYHFRVTCNFSLYGLFSSSLSAASQLF